MVVAGVDKGGPGRIAKNGVGIFRSDLQRVVRSVDEFSVTLEHASGTTVPGSFDHPPQSTSEGPGQGVSPRPARDVLFVEVFRLLLVIAGVIGGLAIGNHTGYTGHLGRNTTAPLVGITLGALVTYLAGGIVGRLLDRGVADAVRELRSMPAGEVFAGSVVGTTGLLLGLVAGLPLVALVHSSIDYPLVAAFAWVLCAAGVRLGVTKGQEIVRAAGCRPSRRPARRSPAGDRPAGRQLGGDGPLSPGPRAVRAPGRRHRGPPLRASTRSAPWPHSPDPVSSRRAHRGLEAIEALRAGGVDVRMNEDEVPELDDTGDRALAVGPPPARPPGHLLGRPGRPGRGRGHRRRRPAPAGMSELAPDHPPGERLVIDLVKEGRQPRQAVGYLPEGDMVVVNDASHLVGRDHVEVVVSSARQTSQGYLVFAQLSRGRSLGVAQNEPSAPESSGPDGGACARAACRRLRSGRGVRERRGFGERRGQAAFTAATSLVSVSLASPKSMVVFGS